MSDQTKKISFGFSKLSKKTSIVSSALNENKKYDDLNKVEFIDCLEGKSIKLKDPVKLNEGPLVIPLKRQQEVILKREQEVTSCPQVESGESKEFLNGPQVKCANELNNADNEVIGGNGVENITNNSDDPSKKETLDEIAAREILEELNRKKAEDEEKQVYSVPLTSNAPSGEKESTLEDYDNIPVDGFGMAVLRGMGWAPGKGIGKNEKVVTASLPAPRPKGMGLGADKVIKLAENKNSSEELKMVKGSYVRVLAGTERGSYGQVEGFDDESGRLIVKLALKNVSISLNEFMVQLVDSKEFKNNSKVINVSKFEQYKENERKKESNDRTSKDVRENTYNREPASPFQSRKVKKTRSSSLDSEDGVKTQVSKDNIKESRSDKHKADINRLSTSPVRMNKIKEKSQSSSSGHSKYQPKTETNPKYYEKDADDRKRRSYSSDSVDSSSSYGNKHKDKSYSSKSKKSGKKSSVSRQRSSSNSSTSDSSGDYSRKKKNKHKDKKSSSYKYRSRSRSRSPRYHKRKKSKKGR